MNAVVDGHPERVESAEIAPFRGRMLVQFQGRFEFVILEIVGSPHIPQGIGHGDAFLVLDQKQLKAVGRGFLCHRQQVFDDLFLGVHAQLAVGVL